MRSIEWTENSNDAHFLFKARPFGGSVIINANEILC